MIKYNNPITQKIHDIMVPLVGEFMAGGVLKTQCKNIGTSENNLTSDHIPAIAEAVKKGLSLFLGSDAAAKVADQIKHLR